MKKAVTPKKIKKLLIALSAIVIVSLVGVAVLTYVVDPFFHYHSPLPDFPYVVDNQVNMNPGLAEHMEYDSVILGSSMTVNFETDWFKELMGLNTLKLSTSGAYPRDISNLLSKVYEPKSDGSVRNITHAFIGIDPMMYSSSVDTTKYPVPTYLYDDNPINDLEYLINKDVLLNYIIKPVADPEPLNWSHIYASWFPEENYNEEYVLSMHPMIKEKNPEKMPADNFEKPIRENLRANIIPYVEAHPETQFVMFFPPYSILFWNDAIMENHLEATIESYVTIVDEMEKYDNVSFFFFPDDAEVVCDLNNYADYTHYHPRINRMITECIASGRRRVACGKYSDGLTIREYTDSLRKMIAEYDFDELQNKLLQYN